MPTQESIMRAVVRQQNIEKKDAAIMRAETILKRT
jgi:hypothetical protein